jgi:hypothetical protein
MIQKIMKCGLIGGFILFVWGAVSWTVLPWQKAQINSFADEKEVQSAISNNITGSGLYLLPNLNRYANKSDQLSAAKDRMSEGPFATVVVMANGRSPSMVGNAICTLIVKIISACLVTWLLLKTTNPLEFTKSVKFILVVGILIALSATLPYVIWFGYPGSFAMASLIEIVFGWFFASLAIAKILVKVNHHRKA